MVKILKVDPITPNLTLIQRARTYIAEGKLVIFPTDTVYGLAADPFNEIAVNKVLEVKRRDKSKGFPILIANLAMAKDLVEFSPIAISLAMKFWPGALTLVLPLKKPISDSVTGYRNTLGVRIPNHPIARQLAETPIIGTSANISGQKSPITAEDAIVQLGDAVDLVLDSGPAKEGQPSTIIDLTGPSPKVLREGTIKYSQLSPFLG
ncbi:MAG: L-threonylcarbamoyladenylate synthase [Candidatus Helarchaeota archaeon]